MNKKKKVWKTPAAMAVGRSKEDDTRLVLIEIAKGRHPAMRQLDKLFEILEDQLDKIDEIENPKVQLELLGWFLSTDGILSKAEEEDEFYDLYADACAFFIETAADFEDKQFLMDLVHDLAVRHTGEDGRSAVFLSLNEFLPMSNALEMTNSVLETVQSQDLENVEDVLEALRDMADGLNAPVIYEKASFLLDPDRSNETIIDVANAYYLAGDLETTKRFLSEVIDPGNKDEEEFLDLSVACAHKEGDMDKAMKLAETLYEKFPKEFHLARVSQIVSSARAEVLLDEHEKYRLGDNINEDYIDLLISIEKPDRLKAYIDRFEEDLAGLAAETLERFAERLESINQKEFADRLREWMVEEPEDVDLDDEE